MKYHLLARSSKTVQSVKEWCYNPSRTELQHAQKDASKKGVWDEFLLAAIIDTYPNKIGEIDDHLARP